MLCTCNNLLWCIGREGYTENWSTTEKDSLSLDLYSGSSSAASYISHNASDSIILLDTGFIC